MSTSTATATARPNGKPASGATVENQADPLPTPVETAQQRAEELVAAITGGAKAQVRALRDELDDLARSIEQREAAIKAAIVEHAALVASVYEVRDIVAPAIGRIRTDFEDGLPKLPRTVTSAPANANRQH